MGCMELCGGAFAAQRQTPMQIPIVFSANLSVAVSVSVSACLSVRQYERTISNTHCF